MRRFRFRMITIQIPPALGWGLALSIIAVLVLWIAQSNIQSNQVAQSVWAPSSATSTTPLVMERSRFGWADLLRVGIPAVRLGEVAHQPSTLASIGSVLTSAINVQLTDPRTYLSSQIPILLTAPAPQSTISPLPVPNTDVSPIPNEPTQPVDLPEQPEVPPKVSTPSILIYHTHNAEAYQGTSQERYIYNNDALTVIRVGDELEKELTKQGVSVLHDKTHHMDKDFNAAYVNSRKTIQDYLKKQSGLKMIFDMHNDGTALDISTTVINKEPVARILIVLGTNPKLGITPDFSKNEAFAKALHKKMEELYPGLSRGVFYEPLGRYNQDLSPNALLLEIGGNLNSMDEALRSARYLAKALAELNKTR